MNAHPMNCILHIFILSGLKLSSVKQSHSRGPRVTTTPSRRRLNNNKSPRVAVKFVHAAKEGELKLCTLSLSNIANALETQEVGGHVMRGQSASIDCHRGQFTWLANSPYSSSPSLSNITMQLAIDRPLLLYCNKLHFCTVEIRTYLLLTKALFWCFAW